MEKIGGLVPVDPYSTEIITKQVVERIARKEAQAIWNPVCLITRVIEIWLCSLSEVPNGLSAFLVCSRPNSESNSIEGMTGVLLEDVSVVDAVWLASTSADLNVVWETRLTQLALPRIVETRRLLSWRHVVIEQSHCPVPDED